MIKILLSLLVMIFSLFKLAFGIIAIIVHIWTVIIALSKSGILAAILTLMFPILSEIYWMFAMFEENSFYSYLVLSYLILGFFVFLLKKI